MAVITHAYLMAKVKQSKPNGGKYMLTGSLLLTVDRNARKQTKVLFPSIQKSTDCGTHANSEITTKH